MPSIKTLHSSRLLIGEPSSSAAFGFPLRFPDSSWKHFQRCIWRSSPPAPRPPFPSRWLPWGLRVQEFHLGRSRINLRLQVSNPLFSLLTLQFQSASTHLELSPWSQPRRVVSFVGPSNFWRLCHSSVDRFDYSFWSTVSSCPVEANLAWAYHIEIPTWATTWAFFCWFLAEAIVRAKLLEGGA